MIFRDRKDSAEKGEPDPGPSTPAASGGSEVESILSERVEAILEAAEQAAVGIREDAEEQAGRYLDDSRHRADEIAADRIREISDLTDALVNRVRAVAQQSDELIAALDDAGKRITGSTPDPIDPVRSDPAPHAFDPDPPPAPASPPAPTAPPPAVMAPPFDAAPPAQAPPVETAPAPQLQAPYQPQPGPPPLPAVPPPAPVAPASPARAPAPTFPQEPAPPEPPAAPEPAARAQPAMPETVETPHISEGARLLATQMAVAGSGRDEISWRLSEEFGIQDPNAILDEIGI